MARRTSLSPWEQPVNPYTFAYALGYRQWWGPEDGERACFMQGDGLCCRIYEGHIELDLYAREPNAETTEYGSNVFRFDLPATVRDWFVQLCAVEQCWTETEKDQREFLEMYEAADVDRRMEAIKQLLRWMARTESTPMDEPQQGVLPW